MKTAQLPVELTADRSQSIVIDAEIKNRSRFAEIAPVPVKIEQTGLPVQLLRELLLKHLLEKSVVTVTEIAIDMAVAGAVISELVQLLRDEALVELSSARISGTDLAFRLTERGMLEARTALLKSGYVGPAPVSLNHYIATIGHFSLLNHLVSNKQVDALFSGMVIDQEMKNLLGASLNSHRAMFVYGPAGTGKTYTIAKLKGLYGDACLIPHAVAAGSTIIQLFDPHLHKPLADESVDTDCIRYAESYDRRFVPCERPLVLVGGEMTLDQLEVSFEPETRLYQAPLQMKANGGLFIIDDMGRQQAPPEAIFNRWIVPMEGRKDYLVLTNGQHFEVPFDVQLIFSSNINPLELADEAFLRRIGFKVRFEYANRISYGEIWKQELAKCDIEFDPGILNYVFEDLYEKRKMPMAPCHPRDLVNTALSKIDYLGAERVLTEALMDWAWNSYFVQFTALESE